MVSQTITLNPVILTIAPNGARKSKHDHPMLPITPADLAHEAKVCQTEGAAMIHLHVRDEDHNHTLDVGRYRDAIDAIRGAVGEAIVIQATTEAVGMYNAQQQMDMVIALQPEAVSLSIRELVPEGGEEHARSFFAELMALKIMPQLIISSVEELRRYELLVRDDIIPFDNPFLLFVLGRYTTGQQSHPRDLLPFIITLKPECPWAVCAFGPLELAATSSALALGGHVRVGFENNMLLKDGESASQNSDLVRQIRGVSEAIGRPVATARDVRAMFLGTKTETAI
ncbi:3-keto-5-aminohexanoate cleavage protein [Sneathiella sp.]|uniref:3-keto-5-aminohexanoate cleavage protein n=1 Tax=Sneathiella sp. TaxID=1964365 RepID=UPI003563A53E